MTPSKALFWACISFVIGIGLQTAIEIPHIVLWGFLLLGAVFIAASFFAKKEAAIAGFLLLFFVMGVARMQTAQIDALQDPLQKLNGRPEKITFVGQIIGEPDIRDTFQKLKVKIKGAGSVILVTLPRYPQYQYLDVIELTGKLKEPFVTEDFNYKNYLLKDKIYSVMDFPKIQIMASAKPRNPAEFLYQKILLFKAGLAHSITTNFAPPHSAILQGILLGGTATMSQEIKDKFSVTGLADLTAVSGSNIVILSNLLMIFLLMLGFWRGQAFYVSIALLWLYIALVGFEASGVRAAIMASIFLLSQKLGRQNTSSRVIVLAAALMLLQNPLLLFYDIGFQLSFLASLGIIHVKPIIGNALPFINHEKMKYWTDIIAVTLAAQITTLPLIAYYFKNISLVAPVTNFLIIPVVDGIMVLGFAAALAGIFSGMLGFLVSIPAWLLLEYFIRVMNLFYWPWSAISLPEFFWAWVPVYYAALAGLVWFLNRKMQPKFLGY